MEKKTRTFNSIRNIFVGILSQILAIILGFISRTVFIKILGVEFLGINGLFSNIIMVLSLAEMGIGTAILYSLYEPVKQKDTLKISALMQYYKKMYRIVALIVAILGAVLIPFLNILVKTNQPIKHLTLFYILYLTNSVLSYLFAYQATIIIASQKMYITKISSFVFYTLQFILQNIFLILTHNFIGYLVIQLICTLGTNVFNAYIANKLYPFINQKNRLDLHEKNIITDNIKSLFLYRIGGVILNNTDNILISFLIGTIWVGYYSNYYLIISALLTSINIIFVSMNASVGNLNVTSSKLHKYKIFNVFNFAAFWIAGFASICLATLFNDFIILWIGKAYLLDNLTEIAIILNFYIYGILNPIWSFREATGFFKQTKYVFLCTAALNIIFSLILGKILGISGILFATAISRLLTNFWYEPLVLYRNYFEKSVKIYFVQEMKFLIVILFAGLITFALASLFNTYSILSFLLKLILCLIIPNLIFFIIFRKNKNFEYIFKNIFKKYTLKFLKND